MHLLSIWERLKVLSTPIEEVDPLTLMPFFDNKKYKIGSFIIVSYETLPKGFWSRSFCRSTSRESFLNSPQLFGILADITRPNFLPLGINKVFLILHMHSFNALFIRCGGRPDSKLLWLGSANRSTTASNGCLMENVKSTRMPDCIQSQYANKHAFLNVDTKKKKMGLERDKVRSETMLRCKTWLLSTVAAPRRLGVQRCIPLNSGVAR